MAVYNDRVKETTSTTGTGTFSLDGAEPGYQSFVTGVGTGVLVTYSIEDGADWEVGEGTITDGTPDTLTRTTILGSSNGGAAVSFGAGAKSIFLTLAAARLVTTDKDNTLLGRTLVADGSITSPSIAFSSDSDIGLYRSGANSLGINAGSGSTIPPLLVTGQDGGTSGLEIVGFNDGFPDILVTGTATDLSLGVYAKGAGGVRIGNFGGSNNLIVEGSAAQYLYIGNLSGITTLETVGTSNNVRLCASGGATTAGITLATYATDYRNLFTAYPRATITGTQNYISALSGNPGVAPTIEPAGGDANINLDLFAKGTGSIRLAGTNTTISSTGAISTTQIFTHSGSTAHTVSTTGAVTFTGAVVQSTKGFAAAEFSAGSGAPGTITWSNGQNQVRTLTSSGTMTFASPTAGATYKLRIVQGGSGSYTITFPTIKWAGGSAPTLSTAVGAEDIITLYYNGTSYYGQAATGFA